MSLKEKQVRIAVVGMGIGRPNGAALSRNSRGKVVALCDLDEARMKDFAKNFARESKILHRLQKNVSSIRY